MILILTGPQHSGKTSFLMRTANDYKKNKIKYEGFLSIVSIKEQTISGYDLFDLHEQKSIPFIRRKGKKDWEKIGPFYFIPQALNQAKRLILQGKEDAVFFIDEIGPLELKGKGLWPALKQVIFSDRRTFLVVVRRIILEDFLDIVKGKEFKIYDIEDKYIFPWPAV